MNEILTFFPYLVSEIFTVKTLQKISGDKITFLIFESCLVTTLIWVMLKDLMSRNGGLKLKRGAAGTKLLYEFVVVFITLILTQIVALTSWGEGYKVGLYITNILIIIYLGFYNAWFKNQLVGIIIRLEDKWDSL